MSAVASLGKILVILLSVCVNLQGTRAGQDKQYYSQMPLSSDRDKHLPTEQVKTSSLLDLLQLKASMSDLLDNAEASSAKSLGNNEGLPHLGLHKRVFCNGFTGCGGRFRGRRRQQLPDPSVGKRVFCNHFGCSNNGKRSSSEVASEITDDELLQHKTMASSKDWLEGRWKRLFCNGYGGCQNMGKRWSALAQGLTDGQQAPLVIPYPKDALDSVPNHKRFFASGFDDDVDELIDSMRR